MTLYEITTHKYFGSLYVLCWFLLAASGQELVASHQLRRVPPSPSKALMIWADHFATSSSRRVRSVDWNSARSNTEYLPAGMGPPRKISTGPNFCSSVMLSLRTAECICSKIVESLNRKEKSRSTAGNFESG